MKVTWMMLSLLLGSGVVFGERECYTNQVLSCYEGMVYYEGMGFPFYGEDAEELDLTCRMMNFSFECMEVYLDLCKGRAECDKECQEMVNNIESFSENTGLRKIQEELCNPQSAMREAYLENYSCLESNKHHYEACHNDTQLSQEYLTTIEDSMQAVEARCCFFTWYHDCFTNITRDSCNENGTFFVSFTLHNLVGHLSHKLCGPNPKVCDRPPLPPIDEDHEIFPLDDGHKNITHIDDNSVEDKLKSNAVYPVYNAWTLCTTLFYIFLMLYLIK